MKYRICWKHKNRGYTITTEYTFSEFEADIFARRQNENFKDFTYWIEPEN